MKWTVSAPLLPAAIGTAALAAWTAWPAAPAVPPWLAAAAAALLATPAWWHERAGRRALQRRVAALDNASTQQRHALDQALTASRRVEQALQASEQRYALALRGASDGLWEWDPAIDRLLPTPRWLHLTGRDADTSPPLSLSDWQALQHPDDRDAVAQAWRDHLAGHSERFEQALRLRHADGRWVWVLCRASALRHAGGRVQRVVALDTDISRLKQVEALIEAVAEGTAHAGGLPFFDALVKHFAQALQIDTAFITECSDRPATRVRTLACWRRGGFVPNFEYALAGTPCERVIGEARACLHTSGLSRLFPREASREGYLGLPIVARDGDVLGHLAFLSDTPLADDVMLASVYRIFTARAAVEIELAQALRRLERVAA
jgi:PAS domain S-box-containing protein